jgi:hypothetical protein
MPFALRLLSWADGSPFDRRPRIPSRGHHNRRRIWRRMPLRSRGWSCGGASPSCSGRTARTLQTQTSPHSKASNNTLTPRWSFSVILSAALASSQLWLPSISAAPQKGSAAEASAVLEWVATTRRWRGRAACGWVAMGLLPWCMHRMARRHVGCNPWSACRSGWISAVVDCSLQQES